MEVIGSNPILPTKTYMPDSPEEFNPILLIQEVKARTGQEPETGHLYVLALGALAAEVVEENGGVRPEDFELAARLASLSSESAAHVIACDPCLNGLKHVLFIYR